MFARLRLALTLRLSVGLLGGLYISSTGEECPDDEAEYEDEDEDTQEERGSSSSGMI